MNHWWLFYFLMGFWGILTDLFEPNHWLGKSESLLDGQFGVTTMVAVGIKPRNSMGHGFRSYIESPEGIIVVFFKPYYYIHTGIAIL